MCAEKFNKSEGYSKTRGSFDELNVEEQAVFIVESAVNMIVKSVQKAGDAFSNAFEEMKMDGDDDAAAKSEPVKKKAKPAQKKARAKTASKTSAKGGKSKSSS